MKETGLRLDFDLLRRFGIKPSFVGAASARRTGLSRIQVSARPIPTRQQAAALHPGTFRDTLIECRKRPRGARCIGLLSVAKTKDDLLHAFCLECGTEHMLVSNWQETRWSYESEPSPQRFEN